MAKTVTGNVVLSYLETVGASIELRYTILHGSDWSEPVTVASGVDWFVSWADIPSVVPLTKSLWAAHWRVNSAAGALSHDAVTSISTDAGRSWQPATLLNTDGTATEHGFVSLYPVEEKVGAVWLDGRSYATTGAAVGSSGTQLRAVTLTSESERSVEVIVDDLVCDCCQIDATISGNGPVIAYRNRSTKEIRDVHFSSLTNGHWSKGRAVASDGWEIDGCPINGPAIDAIGSRIALAWYTAEPTPKVQVVFSPDGGESFSIPITVAATYPIGRVDVALLADGSAAVSWLEQTSSGLMVQQVTADGALGSLLEVAKVENKRNAGFPKMVSDQGMLIFAWTDVSAPQSRVRTSRVVL